jgi:hypothetical protein
MGNESNTSNSTTTKETLTQDTLGCSHFKAAKWHDFLIMLFLSLLSIEIPIRAQEYTAGTTRDYSLESTAHVVRWSGSLPGEAGKSIRLRFSLYQEPTGGAALWSETKEVAVGRDGHYSVLLGDADPDGLPKEIFVDSGVRWIEVQRCNPELSGNLGDDPIAKTDGASLGKRSLLSTSPYAFESMDSATLGGRPASEYLTRDDMDSALSRALTGVVSPELIRLRPISPNAIGNSGFLPIWTSSTQLGNSLISESGVNTGIATLTPATTLDVNGASTLRGDVNLASSVASATGGSDSPRLQLQATTYSSASNAFVQQNFVWQAIGKDNNTSNPTASLALLFGSGTSTPTPTGLSIAPNGQITFAQGQTFPAIYGGSSGASSQMVSEGLAGQIAFYNGNGTSIAGMNVIPLTAGGTGSTSAAGALMSLGGISSTATSQQTMAGPLNGPSASFSGNLTAANITSSSYDSSTGSHLHVATEQNVRNAASVSIKEFGAVGDGVTDDTVALKAALSYEFANDGCIYFPIGAYMTKAALVWDTNKVLCLIGERSTASYIDYMGTDAVDATLLVQNTTVSANGYYAAVEFRNIGFAANTHASYALHAVQVGPPAQLDNVDFMGGSVSAFEGDIWNGQADLRNLRVSAVAFWPVTGGTCVNGITFGGGFFRGTSNYLPSGQFSMETPTVEGCTGVGLNFANAGSITVSNAQIAGNHQQLYLNCTSCNANGNFFAEILLEDCVAGSTCHGGSSSVSSAVYGSGNVFIGMNSGWNPFLIYGSRNQFLGRNEFTPVVESGAVGNIFENNYINPGSSDSGTGTIGFGNSDVSGNPVAAFNQWEASSTATTQSANDNSGKLATTADAASLVAIAPMTATASGIITGGNDTSRTTLTTIDSTSFTTTGLILPAVPVSTTKTGRCTVYWKMSNTSDMATFGIGMSNPPIGFWGGTSVTYTAEGKSSWLAFSQTITTATAISTAAAAGATDTPYRAEVDFTLQTGVTSPVTVTLYGQVSNDRATLAIEPGSACYWFP